MAANCGDALPAWGRTADTWDAPLLWGRATAVGTCRCCGDVPLLRGYTVVVGTCYLYGDGK